MRISKNPLLDALCAEYLVGTLRGGARRRFEKAVRTEALVAMRLRYWQATATPRYAESIAIEPPARLWTRLERDLQLARYRPPWFQRIALWRAWAAAATLALAVVVLTHERAPHPPALTDLAQLSGAAGTVQVLARRSADGRTLVLQASRPVVAGPTQSYELWVIPGPATAPVSVAVMGSLDVTLQLSPQAAARIRGGATLAISTEPAGGSPTGQPTGAVILAGPVKT